MEEMNYFQGLAAGLKTLGVGLKTTMREFFTKKITEQYPENRKELQMFDRFRGSLVMPHNENNEHKCIACGLCMTNCPNGTITVTSQMVETEDGKKKKVLDKYVYDQGICMYCEVCVRVCPQKLVKQLNKPGSKCEERKPVARPAAAAAKPAAADKAAEAPKAESAKDATADKTEV